MKASSLTILVVALAASARAQDTTVVSVRVEIRHDALPIEDVLVRSDHVRRSTDEAGIATLPLAAGLRQIVTAKIGFKAETLVVTVRPGVDTTVMIALTEQASELSGIVVSATRSGRRIEDEPLRVEVLEQEEVEEKLLMTPGDITMMLNESSGLRVQNTSPSLGGATVRVQGLRGRYTQILSDGLPLYGGQTGGLGLLQIPPRDLGAVEIIKGVASALYGGSALGGVINLISRRPGAEPARELLLNQTTLDGTDAVGFASGRLSERWGYSALGGGHRQNEVDKDDDGWIDVPGYERIVLRPRVFWSSPRGHSLMLTSGATVERREGGTMPGRSPLGPGVYPERLRTHRYDAGLVGGYLLRGGAILSARSAAAVQQHRHTFGHIRERDTHVTWLGETAITIPSGGSLWVLGAAVQQERYRSEDVAQLDFTFTTPAAFVQNTVTLSPSLSVTASARVDQHSQYGTQFAPRVSALYRLTPAWTLRASAGAGYFAPTPFTEETEVIGLTAVATPLEVREERARSMSIDVGGSVGTVEVNLTMFGSLIRDPVGVRPLQSDPDVVELVNLEHPTRTLGSELLIRWKPEPFHLTASYTLVRSAEWDPETGMRRDAPLTPEHQAGVVTTWEREGRARVGVEVYFTGVQQLEDNPYRSESKPHVHIGLLAEKRFGAARVFINAENLLNYRQTRYEPLLRPSPGLGGRWTTDVWAPLEGRVANVGLRLDL